MADETCRRDSSSAVTSTGAQRHPSLSNDEADSLPSIRLPMRTNREAFLLACVLALSPAILAGCIAFRAGRDLTEPFLIGEGIAFLVGVFVLGWGVRGVDPLRGVVGGLTCVLALGFAFIACGFETICFDASIEVVVVFTNAKTGKPIENAAVSFAHRNPLAASTTNREGKLAVRCAFPATGRRTIVCDTIDVAFDGVMTRASATGYEPIHIGFHNLAGPGRSIHAPALPPIRIQLTPKR